MKDEVCRKLNAFLRMSLRWTEHLLLTPVALLAAIAFSTWLRLPTWLRKLFDVPHRENRR